MGTRTQQPGRWDITVGGNRARGKNKGEEQTEDGGTEGEVCKAVVNQPAQHTHQLAHGRAVKTAAFSFSPSLPWPDPYLTLVRSLRSVHLLDMSVQVIGPRKERTKTDFNIKPQKMSHTLGQSPQPHPHTHCWKGFPLPHPSMTKTQSPPSCGPTGPGLSALVFSRGEGKWAFVSNLAYPPPPNRNSIISRT